uniref:C2H2-type domain-containing protein n=1 Tax=Leptobrachium leishanense TaxID=445787 RepID=A0A8C5PCE9_9ANUR
MMNVNQEMEKILDLTLEIICLLTGEDYMVVKTGRRVSHSKSHKVSQVKNCTPIPSMVPPPHSAIQGRSNEQKILDLTYKIIRLLTGEVPIRCEDVTVHLSMEEWEYVERHKHLYKDVVMEDHLPLGVLADGSLGRTTLNGCLNSDVSLDSINMERSDHKDNRTKERSEKPVNKVGLDPVCNGKAERTDLITSTEVTQTKGPAVCVKEESTSCKDIYISTPTENTQEHTCIGIKEETLCDDRKPNDTNIYCPSKRRETEYLSSCVKEEAASSDGGEPSISIILPPQPEYPFPHIMEEQTSCDGVEPFHGIIHPPTSQAQPEDQSSPIKEETALCDRGDLSDSDIYPSTRYAVVEYPSAPIKEESTTCDGGDFSDNEVYAPTGRTRSEYTSAQVGKELTLWEEGGTDASPPIEHKQTEYSLTHAKEVSCDEENPTTIETDARQTLGSWINGEEEVVKTKHKPVTITLGSSNGPNMNKLSICEQNTQTISSSNYKVVHMTEKTLSCFQCGRCFMDKSSFIKHQWCHMGKQPFPCSECEKWFSRCSDLVKHQKTHMGEKPFSCCVCGKCFMDKSCFVKHQWIHLGSKPLTCCICRKSFVCSSYLVKHLQIHPLEKPFPCSECGKWFRLVSQRVLHQRTHTGEKPFSCSDCGKSFAVKANLAMHQKTHTGIKQYSCSQCGKCFTFKASLISHQICHTGKKLNSCTQCGKSFAWKSGLRSHKKIHMERNPFLCPTCGKSFISKSSLKLHERIHSGCKPFSCSECGKRFNNRRDLAQHEAIHSGDNRFSCSQCGVCFVHKISLTKHQKTHTGNRVNRAKMAETQQEK